MARCDGHGLAENKKPYTFRVSVQVAGVQAGSGSDGVAVEVVVAPEQAAVLQALVTTGCRDA